MKIVTLIRLDNGQPFAARTQMITNAADGSVSFQLLDGPTAGQFVGQTPSDGQPWASIYGVRYPDSTDCGSYQRATLYGNLVTFVTRPQDIPCVYLLGLGQAY